MNYIIRIQDVFNGILSETKKELVVVKGLYKKVHIGPLFFEIDPYECLIPNIHKETKLDNPSAEEIILAAYNLLKEENMLKKGTLSTMAHWQYVNGVTNEMLNSNNYKGEN